MILIITEEKDVSTIEVLNWLDFYNKEFCIINENTIVRLISYEIDLGKIDFTLAVDETKVKYSSIEGYWHRRAQINNSFIVDPKPYKSKEFLSIIFKYVASEDRKLLENIYFLLKEKKSIGGFSNCDINKLEMLIVAKKVGLLIPKTLITNKRQLVIDYFESTPIISKGIQYMPNIHTPNYIIYSYTEKVNIKDLDSEFQNTLFQELIEKKFEIRSFVLDNIIKSVAIISQNDNQTKVDFRKYNYKKPNRIMPFILPKRIERKIFSLMKKLRINTGSIDIILTPENKYVFLEVNPIGQYANLSYHGNFYIDKIIAEKLCF